MLHIILRLILSPIAIIADLGGTFCMIIIGLLSFQERGTNENGFINFYTIELWRKPWFKNKY